MMEVETNSKQRIVSKSGKQGQSASISHREKLKTAHDLTDAQISAFREIFEYLDVDLSGHITDEELLCRTQQLGINITQKEVKDAMDAIPLDVNGEIDFEGFLKYMTCNQRYDEAITTSSDVDKVPKEGLLFVAVTKYIESHKQGGLVPAHRVKSGHIDELENYFAVKAKTYHPHVVGDFAATWRLVGLTDRQLYKHFMGLARDTTHRDSPYAQPPPMHLFKLHRGKVSKSTPSSPAMARKPKTGTQTVAPSHTAKLPTRNTPDVEAESRLHRSKYHRRSFSLPTVKVTVPKHREVNVDDLPELRKQADAIRKQFLQEQGLKGKSMFQKHWVNVKGNEISSDNLKSRMKTTFNVYSSNINTPRPVPL